MVPNSQNTTSVHSEHNLVHWNDADVSYHKTYSFGKYSIIKDSVTTDRLSICTINMVNFEKSQKLSYQYVFFSSSHVFRRFKKNGLSQRGPNKRADILTMADILKASSLVNI